jgi:hypothetical protein
MERGGVAGTEAVTILTPTATEQSAGNVREPGTFATSDIDE